MTLTIALALPASLLTCGCASPSPTIRPLSITQADGEIRQPTTGVAFDDPGEGFTRLSDLERATVALFGQSADIEIEAAMLYDEEHGTLLILLVIPIDSSDPAELEAYVSHRRRQAERNGDRVVLARVKDGFAEVAVSSTERMLATMERAVLVEQDGGARFALFVAKGHDLRTMGRLVRSFHVVR